jgi:hypothetical protein
MPTKIKANSMNFSIEHLLLFEFIKKKTFNVYLQFGRYQFYEDTILITPYFNIR